MLVLLCTIKRMRVYRLIEFQNSLLLTYLRVIKKLKQKNSSSILPIVFGSSKNTFFKSNLYRRATMYGKNVIIIVFKSIFKHFAYSGSTNQSNE